MVVLKQETLAFRSMSIFFNSVDFCRLFKTSEKARKPIRISSVTVHDCFTGGKI